MNHAAFDSVMRQKMFSADGLEKLLVSAKETNNRLLINVDSGSKEVKAEWLLLNDESWSTRYLSREGPQAADGTRRFYGLVALHITTKDLPNWFWADFGHRDCEKEENGYACKAAGYVAQNDPVDTTTRGPGATHGSNGIRDETRGTVWANYILRGTQTGFVKASGEPTKLSNPVIEDQSQDSSCITCHAYATVGSGNGKRDHVYSLDPRDPPPGSDLDLTTPGAPVMKYFGDPEITYLQTDFMWSPVKFAYRKTPDCP